MSLIRRLPNAICAPICFLIWLSSAHGAQKAAEQATALSLKEAIRKADYSREVLQGQAAIEEANSQVARSYEGFYPTVSMRGNYDFVGEQKQYYVNADISLYNQGRDFQRVKLAKFDEDLAAEQKNNRRLQTQVSVVDYYMLASFAEMQREFYEKEIEGLRGLQERIRRLVRSQAASWRQEAKIDREVMLLEQRLADAVQQNREALTRLKALLALKPDAPLALEPMPMPKIDQAWLDSLDSIRDRAVRNSPALSILSLQSEQLDVRKAQAYSDFLPRVFLNGKYGRLDFSSRPQERRSEFSIGVEVPLPVFKAPLLVAPIERSFASERKQLELARSITAEALGSELKVRMSRIRHVSKQLEGVADLRKIIDRERKEEQKSFVIGALDSSSYLTMLQQTRESALIILGYRRTLMADYAVVRLLAGAPIELSP